jgi:hypothetical protein
MENVSRKDNDIFVFALMEHVMQVKVDMCKILQRRTAAIKTEFIILMLYMNIQLSVPYLTWHFSSMIAALS